MSDEPAPGGAPGEQRGVVARLRAVIEAKDVENAALRAGLAGLRTELDAERELRRLELQVAELSRRLGMDSTDSGTPTSKEPAEAKERRKAERRNRQAPERERRKDRRRGGQPGHAGAGLSRDPDPRERKSADPPAQCSRCGAALGGTEHAGSSWAQVWDVKISRLVTEWLLPALQCPCCGQVTVAAAPVRGASGQRAVRAGDQHGGGAAGRLRERARRAGREPDPHAAGHPGLARVRGQGEREAGRAAGRRRIR